MYQGSFQRRRAFLSDVGMGVTGMALGAMLQRDQIVRADSPHAPAAIAKAKSVIWIFLVGGMSHMESFDPKPKLNEFADKSIDETPYKDVYESPYYKKNVREVVEGLHKVWPKVYPMQIGYRQHGQSGLAISDWWENTAKLADDLAIVRGMWTTDNNHGAQLQFHTGRHALEGSLPTIGSWVHWGLGSQNDNLPSFCVMGTPLADCCGGLGGHGANYLGPTHDGIQLSTDPNAPLPFATPGADVFRDEQAAQFGLLNKLNRLTAVEYPNDPALKARITAYELAFQMQSALPDVVNINQETGNTQSMYGVSVEPTATFGRQCLVARRLVERGVRFVQLFHGSNGGAGNWDAHGNLKAGHSGLCKQVDLPIAGLIADLKQRGMLEETLVVIGTEFGRTPGAQGSDGRDHHPYGFSVVMAGGGLKGGIAHGATDDIGFHSIEGRHYVTDIHATVLHQMGLDHRAMEIPGRKRLDIDFGNPIREIIS